MWLLSPWLWWWCLHSTNTSLVLVIQLGNTNTLGNQLIFAILHLLPVSPVISSKSLSSLSQGSTYSLLAPQILFCFFFSDSVLLLGKLIFICLKATGICKLTKKWKHFCNFSKYSQIGISITSLNEKKAWWKMSTVTYVFIFLHFY